MKIKLVKPRSKKEFKKYFSFRWKMLRQPLNQPLGTEKDSLENDSYHIMLVNDDLALLGVGRIHIIGNQDEFLIAQVRYMAIDSLYQNKGLGTLILNHLESYAIQNKVCKIILNARENAVDFYIKNGYKDKSPYDLVLIDNPLFNIPNEILNQLNANHGRLIMIKKFHDNLGKCICLTNNKGKFNKEILFDIFTKFELYKNEEEFIF